MEETTAIERTIRDRNGCSAPTSSILKLPPHV
ncbi:hypothetical protein HNR77_003505 [Paenibacillus sp. JGP012]|nr:hypothetical protein [Paenibacillus sp. JGP012]